MIAGLLKFTSDDGIFLSPQYYPGSTRLRAEILATNHDNLLWP
jgi:hypothetical protein